MNKLPISVPVCALVIIAWLVAPAGHASQSITPPAQAQPAPHIVFEEAEHDFGTLGQDQTVKHTFKFKNTGNAVLIIGDIKTTCGCTGTLVSQREIAPAGAGSIEVSFHSGRAGGAKRKSIFINSNDPDNPQVKLDILANVLVPLEVRPRTLYWVAEKNEQSVRTIELIYNPDLKVNIQGFEVSSPAFSASYQTLAGTGSTGYQIDLKYDGSLPVGSFQEKLVILTNNAENAKIDVGLRGKVVGPVKVVPDAVAFGQVKSDNLPARSIRIYNTNNRAFSITSIESTSALIDYQLKQDGDSSKYQINVTLKQMPPVGAFSERLTIRTNDPTDPVIEVPVYAYVK